MNPLHPARLTGCVLLLSLALAGCNLPTPQGNATPTVEAIHTPTALTTETVMEPSLTPSATVTEDAPLPPVPLLESPTATLTPGPPTATFTPTETPGPFEHTIQSGETLGYIIQVYGYTDFGVIDEVLRMNPQIPNPDRLPGAGSVILIPRPTATTTPEGFVATEAPPGETLVAPESQLMQHTVKSGETIVGIASQFETTLAVLDQLNPELLFFNCDFSNPSGGPDCNVPLSVDQLVNVPAPTPTPTLSPTPSGSETPTPIPTFAAPMLVVPPQGAVARGSSIRLQWVSIGILPPDHYYLVEVEDTTNGETFFNVTRETTFNVRGEIVPSDGQPHQMRWRIRIGTPTENGTFRAISAETPWRVFEWQGS